jgi:hypothetical protein
MNSFATIIEVQSLPKVTYYTVKLTLNNVEEKDTEFSKFNLSVGNNSSVQSNYNDLRAWMTERIGRAKGAVESYFRKEKHAMALPPRYSDVLVGMKKSNIRLYCYRVNKSIVVLFNGAIKIENKAQDCPNVSSHFHSANSIAKAIIQCLSSGTLKISSDEKKLLFETDFKIPL